MGKTKIEYCDYSWSPITGCTMGCKYCYARRMTKRFEKIWGYDFKPRFHPERLVKHDNWKPGDRVFVCDMGDWLDDKVERSWVEQILRVIADNPKVTFLMLTKQPQNFDDKVHGFCEEYPCRELGGGDYLPNLWHGTTVTCQADADNRIPELLKAVAAKYWISVEPMRGDVRVAGYFKECSYPTWQPDLCLSWAQNGGCSKCPEPGLDWVVCGGMSGHGAVPMHPDWARGLRDQCKEAGVPFFLKQRGEWGDEPYSLVTGKPYECMTAGSDVIHRCGKKAAGRLLDGKEHNEYPEMK